METEKDYETLGDNLGDKCVYCGKKATRIATVSIDVHWSDLDGMAFDGDVIDDLATMPLCDDCSPVSVGKIREGFWAISARAG